VSGEAAPPAAEPGPLAPLLPGRALIAAFARRYARRYLLVYALGLGALLATNWLAVTIPALVKEVFDLLAARAALVEVERLSLWVAVCAVGVIVVRTLSRVLFFNPGRTIEFRLRNDMLERLLEMGGVFHRGVAQGDLVSRATSDATYVRALVGFSVLNLINLVLAAGMALWRMLATDVTLTLLCLVPLASSLLILRAGTSRLFGAMRDGQVELGALSDHILETYKGIAAIATAHADAAFLRRFAQHNRRYTEINLAVMALRCFVLPLASQTGGVAVFLVLLVGGARVVEGALTVGDLAAYVSYIGILVGALVMAGWLIASLQRGFVALQRCWEVLALRPEPRPGAVGLPGRGGLAIELRRLRYSYPDAAAGAPPALAEIDLRLRPGQVLGVAGPVGSGKSTLLALLCGELEPEPGMVLLDGQDVRRIDRAALAEAVAVVPQASFLFSRSLRENVGYVDPPAEIDDARVAEALAAAQLAGELDRLPRGVETVVGERGQMLSGGQRQRAQLARAFYRGGRLLLLDDVLSAVDHDTEQRLLRAIMAARGSGEAAATVVLVSSRPSALRVADVVLELDERGRPVRAAESGAGAAG
jgi:ATP-binding cassette subfamily B protein